MAWAGATVLSWICLFRILLLVIPGLFVAAEPVQYCKSGSEGNVNFCVGLTVHENITSNDHDLYLSFFFTRYDGSDLGWTAIGTGSEMAGSLMFIVYGDPLGMEEPIVSIRRSTGHVQPTLFKREASGGLDIRVLRSQWIPSSLRQKGFTPDHPMYEARVSLVCYSCGRWSGSKIDTMASAHAWIWAWNEKQKFPIFSYDAHLLMHKHHAGAGGWGNFYLDMARAISKAPGPPSLPPIRADTLKLGASETPAGTHGLAIIISAIARPELHLHGILGTLSFLVIFPAGVLSMRSGSTKCFKYHWVIQLMASVLVLIAAIAGLQLRKKISTYHQIQGLVILSIIPLQSFLGWLHHVRFLKLARRTWFSYAHIWAGRVLMAAGSINIVTGLVLRGYSLPVPFSMSVILILENTGLIIFVWWRTMKAHRLDRQGKYETTEQSFAPETYFSLAGEDSDEEEDLESPESKMLDKSTDIKLEKEEP